MSLGVTRTKILDALRTHEPITPTDLAEYVPFETGTVRNHLADLREIGTVESRPDPFDPRRRLYSIADPDAPAIRADGGPRYRDLSAFQREILVTIADLQERPNGLDLLEALEDRLDTDLNHSRLYANLDDLVERGLVEKGEQNDRSNYYDLTSEGYDLLWNRSAELSDVLAGAVADELRTDPEPEHRETASATPEGSP